MKEKNCEKCGGVIKKEPTISLKGIKGFKKVEHFCEWCNLFIFLGAQPQK